MKSLNNYCFCIVLCLFPTTYLAGAEHKPGIDPSSIKYVLTNTGNDGAFFIKAHQCTEETSHTINGIKKEPLIGSIMCKIDKKEPSDGYINSFNVDTLYQGYGVDLALVTKALDEFEQKNCFSVYIDIPRADETTIFFFKILGFKELDSNELVEDDIAMIENIATLRKTLTPFQDLKEYQEISAINPSQTERNASDAISIPIKGVPAPKFKHG